MESLRHIAILIYKIMCIQLYRLLWVTYLKSGVGQLINPSQTKLSCSTTIPIWPKQLKKLIQLPAGKITNDEHDFYLKFVGNHLYELEQRIELFYMELNSKTRNFDGYTIAVQKSIEAYIEQKLLPYHREITNQIELIHYDYHIRALKLECLRHQPNAYQVSLFVPYDMCQ